jgi:hypothetical protein
MPDPHPPYLADALSRFGAAADTAVERGRRAADDARAAGAAFERESAQLLAEFLDRRGEHDDWYDAEPTSADLRAAATEYRTAHGLPLPDLDDEPFDDEPLDDEPDVRTRPAARDEEDFSQFRIMRPL